MQDGEVTGVLDWPGFLITDPVLDVANTVVLTTIPVKYLASTLSEDLSAVDWDMAAELYLSAYRKQKPLDGSRLEYYKVRRAVYALLQGVEGQKVWQHPRIVEDLIQFIQSVTKVRVEMPD
jgi:aminoglycoside phosphotransferase (APT) family kinase protein